MPAAVVLRERRPDDADLLFRLASDLDSWEERRPEPPAPLTRTQWDAQQAVAASDDVVRFMVEADGRAVGAASLFGFDALARHAEVGIALVPEARGRGTGSAAVALLAEFAFVRRNLHRLHLQAIASNGAAIRAYERAGFVVEGRLREHAWVRGEWDDVVLMGLLRSDWHRGATPRSESVAHPR